MPLAHFHLITLLSSAISAIASPSLTLEVTGPSRIYDVDSLQVTAILTNSGNETVRILKDPRGILSEHPANKFSIFNTEGSQPSFDGIEVKYVPEVAAKAGYHVALSPGQFVKVTHNLTDVYNFSTSGSGSYKLKARDIFYVVDKNDAVVTLHATENFHHEIHISGKLESNRPGWPDASRLSTFVNCTSLQQSSVRSAAAAAKTYAANAHSYFGNNNTGTPRYTTWFGPLVASRRKVVSSHFSAINSNDFGGFTYDCSCTDPEMFAYVYPSNFGYIHLCGAFWNAPTTGTDSTAGTIIHESSHFLRNGGTGDIVYGQSSAKSLAITDPASAITNADSHEYFAENNPALS
ncbi:hypothetical protein AGABI1DRAFT_110574 [Agaricus bisporus var. burnettii JB137-S8]|uniref:Lysine-specific metallo-endopeptidase domain-containing protein n=1 Tax=Agaricus bisporus var. burnettii (strain JB137-S8 / ATCC MYA-4627 / FGSC 10392) TaxID=597362 RepID=K5XKB5_AGABU|nr:uncharacterized protein AGABI1DRAFT_110574 [Agaricus bisporus var. burnettii JB137-S8]EKM83973.1 hypothetical protein AGABI1DRAFT_110574 [Agaricus bisporus var. burnettii JB137-S8]